MSRSPLFIVSIFVATCATVPTFAQDTGSTPAPARSGRPPYRGLFGGGLGETEQVLTATTAVGVGTGRQGALDDPSAPSLSPSSTNTTFGTISGQLIYSASRKRVSLSTTAGTSGRYTPSADSTTYQGSYTSNVGASWRLTRTTSLGFNYGFVYQPYSTLLASIVPTAPSTEQDFSELVVPDLTLAAVNGRQITQIAGLNLTKNIGRRNSLSADYSYSRTDLAATADDMNSHSVGAHYSLAIARSVNLRLGYSIVERRLASDTPDVVRGQNWDAGLEFNQGRGIPLTRRTRLRFNGGTYAISDRFGENHYRASANAQVSQSLGRSWVAAVDYNRGMSFIERIREPIFSDGVTASLNGLFNRRWQFRANATTAVGQVGFGTAGTSGTGHRSYTGTSRLSAALNRNMALNVDYSYYHYRFDEAGVLPDGVPRDLNNHSVRASLSLWAPLYHRARRPDASR